eukprot:g11775.t1
MASRLLFGGALLQLTGHTLGMGRPDDQQTGNLNGCAKQGRCLDFTIESVDDTCGLSGNCFYKACMTINLGDDTDGDNCPKENQKSFSHICDQSDDTSSCPLDADNPVWDVRPKKSQGNGTKQCQIGAADNFPAGAEKVIIQVVDENGDEILELGEWTGGTFDIQANLEFEELVYFAFIVSFAGFDDCDPVVVSLTPCDCGFDNANCPPPTICCTNKNQCDEFDPTDGAEACGDPHMTGFLGQKFDFTGQDGGWYSLIAVDNMQVNMRVTCPVPDLPEITYITGLSVLATDANGFDHSVVIEVKDPHTMDSSCPADVSPCLAEGSLRVTLDGEETLLAPGTVSLSPDVKVSAVNLPGACRSFGFEKYWELKQLQNARIGRRLGERLGMGEWILADPTATNMDECMEYVARANLEDGGLFAHQSEHASFQIVTPAATVRLSHGRLHQIAVRDPTDQYDLPDHFTWQMNMAIDHTELKHDTKGVLGETFVPTRDADGKPIMTGMEAIRGTQEDYRVDGALGMDFAQDAYAP